MSAAFIDRSSEIGIATQFVGEGVPIDQADLVVAVAVRHMVTPSAVVVLANRSMARFDQSGLEITGDGILGD